MYKAVMGSTCTLTYIVPYLKIPMTIPVRLHISAVIQILFAIVETLETIQKQVFQEISYKIIFCTVHIFQVTLNFRFWIKERIFI